MEIDHVVLAARSKAEAEAALDEAGLGVARGRVVPGVGLSNLVVPLKEGQLLEILYPNGEAPAPGAPPLLEINLANLAEHSDVPLLPVTWLVLMDEDRTLRELAAAHDMSVQEAPSTGPGYPPYTLAGFGANIERRYLPCLIHWPEGSPPLSAEHRRAPTGITGIDVAGPADEIERWCGGVPDGLRTVPGVAGPQRVEIGLADGGTVTLGVGV